MLTVPIWRIFVLVLDFRNRGRRFALVCFACLLTGFYPPFPCIAIVTEAPSVVMRAILGSWQGVSSRNALGQKKAPYCLCRGGGSCSRTAAIFSLDNSLDRGRSVLAIVLPEGVVHLGPLFGHLGGLYGRNLPRRSRRAPGQGKEEEDEY